jgi:predicted acyltransferase
MSAAQENAPQPTLRPRITSLDQFRGYTVAGMFLVNYMGGTDAFPSILKHHHNFCSYSDTIMPQFLFAVGFAFRLTFGRRAHEQGLSAAYGRMVRRFLGLMLVAMVVYGANRFDTWKQMYHPDLSFGKNLWIILHPLIKREWMQTLGHIAVTSIWILPVIRAGATVRVLWMLLSIAAHVYLSHDAHIFDGYFDTLSRMGGFLWVNYNPSGIDGGPFGFLTWAIPTIMGTLTCDAVIDTPGQPQLKKLAIWSVSLMGLAYILSCGTRLYDVPPETTQAWLAERTAIQEESAANASEPDAEKRNAVAAALSERSQKLNENKFPADPVWPSRERWKGKTLTSMLAEVPVIGRPPNPERDKALASILSTDDLQTRRAKKVAPEDWYYRQWNYWMMSQRGGTVSYPMFSAGFSILVYILFYIVCDKWGFTVGVFRTLGVNALLGYILQGFIGGLVQSFLPGDPPHWYAWANFGVYFFLMWFFLRFFEKQKIFIRM